MNWLEEQPALMMELLAIMVRRSGGRVSIGADESPGPYNLMSAVDPDNQQIHLVLEEGLTTEDVARIQALGDVGHA